MRKRKQVLKAEYCGRTYRVYHDFENCEYRVIMGWCAFDSDGHIVNNSRTIGRFASFGECLGCISYNL